MKASYDGMSMRPWPERLKRITFSSPVSLHLFASRMVAAMAWVLSGAGITLRCRDDTLGAGKEHTGLEGFELRNIYTMHHTVLDKLGDNHAGTMITQTASMDVGRLEVVAEGVHRQQWRVTSLVTEVVTELTARQLRTTIGLCCDKLCGLAVK